MNFNYKKSKFKFQFSYRATVGLSLHKQKLLSWRKSLCSAYLIGIFYWFARETSAATVKNFTWT